MPPSERLIFNFNSKDELKRWHLYSDSEYGGIQLIYVASKSQSLRASSFARQASPPRTDPPPSHPINKTPVNVACYEGLHHQCRPQLHPIFSPLIDSKRVATVSLSDPVIVAAKRLREFKVNSVIIVSGSQPQGILISKDVLMRVVAQNLSPELTLVEKVMTANPECATLNTTILEALHTMHDGKFLHLPVVDKAISMVEGSGAGAANDMATSMMQKFWDSALASHLMRNMTLEANGYCVCLLDLPIRYTVKQVQEVFASYDKIVPNSITIHHRGNGFYYGYIRFIRYQSMVNAIQALPIFLRKRAIYVYAKEPEEWFL